MRPLPESNNMLPRISFKSAFIIIGAILVGSIFFPFVLNQFNLGLKPLRVIVTTLSASFTACYCFFFIESNKGFSKNFWLTFIGLSLIIGMISVFWIYELIYI